MLKSALLTWHVYNNYGSVLQLYALNKVIKDKGLENDIINYQSVLPRNAYPFYYIKKIIPKLRSYIYMNLYLSYTDLLEEQKKRNEKFDIFRSKEFSFTHECKTASDLFQLNNEYDAFICGSDQIWSPLVFDTHYYLDFVTNTNKMIAYAPSFGKDEIDDSDIALEMHRLLNRFVHLSVREDSGCNIVKKLTEKDCEHVLDPSMLLGKNDYDNIINKYVTSNEHEKYILCYFLGENEKYWKIIKKFAQKIGLPVRVIPVFNKDYCRKRPFEVCRQTGPAEFLNLVRNASFICTDSFHGTIFSIIYSKPFFIFKRFSENDTLNQNTRIFSLLKLFNLEDRLIKNYNEIKKIKNSTIDFESVNNILDEQRNKSINYLSNSLKSAVSDITNDSDFKITNTCSGCAACTFVCKQNAVQIKLNDSGFYESVIEKNICIKCGECRDVCPFGKYTAVKINEKDSLYAAVSKDTGILTSSSSGGIGWELAKYYNVKGKDVFGCIYNKSEKKAETICITANESEKLPGLCGSKYIQSDTSGIYKKLYQSNEGIFFGTPCQVAAVNLFLRKYKKRQNFTLVDLICHGVPSSLLWKKYLDEGAKKYHYGENPDVLFRNKKNGWREIYIYIYGNGRKYLKRERKDNFYHFFLRGNCYMDSCYECKFRNSSSADIRIGDYWGPRFKKNNTGVSMVLPMTNAGEKILSILHDEKLIYLEKTDITDYFKYQQTVNKPKPNEYERIIADLRDNKSNLKKLANKYLRYYEMSEKTLRFLRILLFPLIQKMKSN